MELKYSTTIGSDLAIIKKTVNETLKKINPIVDDEDIIFDIKLILNELIVNSVMHGNKCIGSKCVKLLLEVQTNKIKIQVEDEGQGIDYDFNSYDPKELSSCGRGLVIVNGLSDEFYIEKNKVTAIKHIKKINSEIY